MSILFEETKEKKPAKKTRGKLFSGIGLSASSKPAASAAPILDIFSDSAVAPKPAAPKRSPSNQFEKEKKTGNQIIQEFIQQDPGLKKYVFILPCSEMNLKREQRHAKAMESATAAQMALEGPNAVRSEMDHAYAAKREKTAKEMESLKPKRFEPFQKKALTYLIDSLNTEIDRRLMWSLDEYTNLSLKLGELVHLVQLHDDFDMTIKFGAIEAEHAMRTFEDTDKRVKQLKTQIRRVKSAMTLVKVKKTKFDEMINEAKQDFDPVSGYFPDTTQAERMLMEFLERGAIDGFNKVLHQAATNKEAIGSIILGVSREFLKDKGEQELQIVFILFCRCIFSCIYPRNLYTSVNGEFDRRVMEMRRLPSVAFGINEKFLPARYRAMPIHEIPVENPYRESVELLLAATFQYCPIDFCKAICDALKSIQSIASKISYEAKVATGRVEAKSDHLLCLDDLSDITLIVFLLSEPYVLGPLVSYFEPYVPGLEMTSELEFGFTNINAVIRHIMELDFVKFMEEAKQRTSSEVEADPLHILG